MRTHFVGLATCYFCMWVVMVNRISFLSECTSNQLNSNSPPTRVQGGLFHGNNWAPQHQQQHLHPLTRLVAGPERLSPLTPLQRPAEFLSARLPSPLAHSGNELFSSSAYPKEPPKLAATHHQVSPLATPLVNQISTKSDWPAQQHAGSRPNHNSFGESNSSAEQPHVGPPQVSTMASIDVNSAEMHNYDWLFQLQGTSNQQQQQEAESSLINEQQSPRSEQKSQTRSLPTTVAGQSPSSSPSSIAMTIDSTSSPSTQEATIPSSTTTTEQSNNIVQAPSIPITDLHAPTSISSFPTIEPKPTFSLSSAPASDHQYEARGLTTNIANQVQSHNQQQQPIITKPTINTVDQQPQHTISSNNNLNLNQNQMTSTDFYFSSSERHPNRERAPNAWWAIGFGQQYELATNLTRDNYLEYCSKSDLLVTNKQRSLCRSHWKIMHVVARGLRMAIDECQSRFSNSRWNCSLAVQDSLSEMGGGAYGQSAEQMQSLHIQPPKSTIFGDVMRHPNRERSFLNAIFGAGLAHVMTKACSAAELPEECGCDKKIRTKNNKGKIDWVACSDDIDFGSRFSREFTDDSEISQLTGGSDDSTAMINLHNYEVGRRVFKSTSDITCTCLNGGSESANLCQIKRCWKHLGPFTDIGDELMRRYERATHVQPSNKDPHKLKPVRRGVRRPKRKDLVYIDESPDYCETDYRLGILGTQSRHCNSTSSGSDSCSLLCCGRGYQMVNEEIEEDCNCQFVYCCKIVCDKCKRNVTYDICN